MNLRKIMVAIKPWDRGLPLAAAHAQQLAKAADARIELVTTVFDAAIGAGCERGDEAARKTHQRAIAAARVDLERLAGSMRAFPVAVTTRIVWGAPPYEALLGAAEDWGADLLVVGAHERATHHPRLTDTDWQLTRRTRCPLLLVKAASFDGYRTILAAVDPLHDEPLGLDRAVLEASRCFAHAFGSTLRAVDAYPVAALRHAELVVVGTQRRRGPTAVAHGNTAELVAGEVPCDILIVPPAEDARTAIGPRSKVG